LRRKTGALNTTTTYTLSAAGANGNAVTAVIARPTWLHRVVGRAVSPAGSHF
jgi:hypothetical protein